MQEILDELPVEENEISIKHKRIVIGGLLVLGGFGALATVLAIDDIETIIGTGPIGSLIGLVVYIVARKLHFPEQQKIGLSAPIFSAVCFLIIFCLDWSPGEAQTPISILIALYTFMLGVAILVEIVRIRRRFVRH